MRTANPVVADSCTAESATHYLATRPVFCRVAPPKRAQRSAHVGSGSKRQASTLQGTVSAIKVGATCGSRTPAVRCGDALPESANNGLVVASGIGHINAAQVS